MCSSDLGLGARGGRAALQANEHQARERAVAYLIYQQLLARAGPAGQKGRHVGAVARAEHDGHARGGQQQPGGEDGGALHLAADGVGAAAEAASAAAVGAGRISISERSPSACSISTLCTTPHAPRMVTLHSQRRRICSSSGVRANFHLSFIASLSIK